MLTATDDCRGIKANPLLAPLFFELGAGHSYLTRPSRLIIRLIRWAVSHDRSGQSMVGIGRKENELRGLQQILEHTLADDELIAALRGMPASSKASVYSFTLDDLEELMGCVAAEANHAKDTKLQKKLDRLFERMEDVLQSYTDADDGPAD